QRGACGSALGLTEYEPKLTGRRPDAPACFGSRQDQPGGTSGLGDQSSPQNRSRSESSLPPAAPGERSWGGGGLVWSTRETTCGEAAVGSARVGDSASSGTRTWPPASAAVLAAPEADDSLDGPAS